MIVPFGGAQTWRPLNVAEQKHLSLSFATETKMSTPELRHIEINASSSASTVYLEKTKAITPLLACNSFFSGRYFHVTQLKSFRVLYYKKNRSVEPKECQTLCSLIEFFI